MTPRQSIARFRLIADLHAAGVALMRQNIRRRHPGLSRREVQRLLAAWLARAAPAPPPGSGLVPRRRGRPKGGAVERENRRAGNGEARSARPPRAHA